MGRFSTIAAGLFTCLAACGDDGNNQLADAPVAPDAQADAAVATGTVNILATVRCCDLAPMTPQAGVVVVAVQPDGTVGTPATTDAEGKAVVEIVEGAAVTAVYPEDTNNERQVTTIVGVKPGDSLTFGDNYYQPPITGGTSGQIDASWDPVAGATYYYTYTPCGGRYTGIPATSAQLFVYDYCQTPTAPILYAAYDNTGFLASAYIPAADFTPGTSLPVPTWTPEATTLNYPLSISGLEAAIYEVQLGAQGVYPRGIQVDHSAYVTPASGAAMADLSMPSTAPRTYANARLWRNGIDGRQQYFKTGAPPVAFAAPALPWIHGLVVDPSQGQALWLQTEGTYDAAIARLNWSRDDGMSTHYFYWDVIVPPGVTSVDLGAPPTALAPYLPTADDNLGTDLELIDLASTADYDGLRGAPEWRWNGPEGAVAAGDEAAAGISSFDGAEGFGFTRPVARVLREGARSMVRGAR